LSIGQVKILSLPDFDADQPPQLSFQDGFRCVVGTIGLTLQAPIPLSVGLETILRRLSFPLS
jgi:hypothetical protein